MIDRSSQEAQFNTAQSPSAQQSGMGSARVDAAKFSKTQTLTDGRSNEAASDRLLNTILNAGGKLAEQFVEKSREEAYLDGVAKAGTLKSEEELQGNRFTKDWQTAGYRDTMGKLASTENESRIAADMKSNREKTPTQFGEYLAERRSELLPQLEGMSLKARQSMFASTMVNERSAIKKHGSEHLAYILEQETKVQRVAANQANDSMTAAQKIGPGPDGKPTGAYETAVDAAYTNAYSIYSNPRYTEEHRGMLINEIAARAIESGNQLLYKKLADRTLAGPDGKPARMLDLVDPEKQIALSKAFTAANTTTAALRDQAFVFEIADLEKRIGAEDSTVLYSEVEAIIQRGQTDHPNAMSSAQQLSLVNKFNDAGARAQDGMGVAMAYFNGNAEELHSKSKGKNNGLEMYDKHIGSKLPISEYSRQLGIIGERTGQMDAYKKMGDISKMGWQAAKTNDVLDPEITKVLGAHIEYIRLNKEGGNAGAVTQYLTAFTPEDQEFILNVRSNVDKKGMTATEAIKEARNIAVQQSKIPPAQRNAMRDKAYSENNTMMQELTTQGPMSFAYDWVKGLGSPDELRTYDENWWSTNERAQDINVTAKAVYGEELTNATRERPTADKEQRDTMARTAMQKRKVKAADGDAFYVPEGQTPQTFFRTNADAAAIGTALDQVSAPKKGNRMQYSVDALGNIEAKELNKANGLAREVQYISRDSVKAQVDKNDKAAADEHGKFNGAGIEKSETHNGVKSSVRYNGDNSAGVSNKWMFDFRTGLTEHERIRSKVYDDGTGVMTNGVGVSTKNTHYPKPDANGNITQAQSEYSFRRASDDAARLATKAMSGSRRENEASFKLWADLAYQAGGNVTHGSKYQALQMAMRNGDYSGAKAALESTLAWDYGKSKERRAYRTQLLIEAMKG